MQSPVCQPVGSQDSGSPNAIMSCKDAHLCSVFDAIMQRMERVEDLVQQVVERLKAADNASARGAHIDMPLHTRDGRPGTISKRYGTITPGALALVLTPPTEVAGAQEPCADATAMVQQQVPEARAVGRHAVVLRPSGDTLETIVDVVDRAYACLKRPLASQMEVFVAPALAPLDLERALCSFVAGELREKPGNLREALAMFGTMPEHLLFKVIATKPQA